MQITQSVTIHVQLVEGQPTGVAAGELGRQIRQAKRELSQLLQATRDSPTMRLKIAEARETLAALESQAPPSVAAPIQLTAVASPQDSAGLQTSHAKLCPPLPPRPKAQAPVWPARVRQSPVQQMRERKTLLSIDEEARP